MWWADRPSLAKAQEAAEDRCASVVDLPGESFSVPAPTEGGDCARAVGAAAGLLGFDRVDLDEVFQLGGGRVVRDGWVMSGETTRTGTLVTFSAA
jgi:hypothetical protein